MSRRRGSESEFESSLGSPNKRLKSQVNDDDNNDDDDESPDRESLNDNQPDSCGICYADRGVSVAGEIDCCNHYFCFVCIMEWAKHESRCPICRCRFSNIRRAPKLGVFSSYRDVKVPVRDQVYHPYGNMTSGPASSHPEVNCSICHGGTDEHLLLLCDLCDMASHTYCVGLGYTVPEGDWFCHDCAVSRAINADKESDQQNVVPTDEPTVTIFDIVRESSSQVFRRPRASALPQNQSFPSVITQPDRVSGFNGSNPKSVRQHVQRNVQALRENWNALRSGSLRFRCSSSESGGTGSQRQDSNSLSQFKSDQSQSVASTSLQQSTVQGGPSNNMVHERGSKDVDKAWKMMDRAKMMQHTHQRTGSIPHGVDHPSCSGGARKISSAHQNYQQVNKERSRTLDFRDTRMKKHCDYSSLNKDLENHWSPMLGEEKQSRSTCEEMLKHASDHTTPLEGYHEPPLPRDVHTGMQGVPCYEDGERNVAKETSSSACLVSSVVSAPPDGKFGSVFSSSREKRPVESFVDGNTRKSEDAKNEIRSLVKLNLKVLTRDKQISVETFKLVARQATHIILAACRSDHQKSNNSSSKSVCSHADNTMQFQKSTLMSNCCRRCFYAFVNDVVNSVMLEKLGRTTST